MDKKEVEEIFRKTGRKPVGRETLGQFDLFFADGFSQPPHLSYQARGDIQPGEFPAGMFVTTWWLGKDENLFVGKDLFFNLSEISLESRINAARKDAERFYKSFRKRMKRLH